jgi:hypothetical protein
VDDNLKRDDDSSKSHRALAHDPDPNDPRSAKHAAQSMTRGGTALPARR